MVKKVARLWRGRKGQGTREGSQARVVRNTLANSGGTLVTVAVGLALSPFMIHRLGVEAYGVWILATTLTYGAGYFSFADFGFEQSAVRYIAEARAAGDEQEMNRIWITVFALLGGIALVITPLLILLARPLVDLFDVPDELRSEAVIAFTFVVAQLLIELPGRAFAAILAGAQRYGLLQLARVVQTLVISGLVVAVLLADKGVDWLGIVTFAGQCVTYALMVALALFGVHGVRFSPRLVSRKTARKLASFGGQLLIFQALGAIYRPMDKAIIGVALSTSAVTTYEVGYKLFTGAAFILALATSTLIPTTAFNRDQPARLREMLFRGSNYVLALALPFVIAASIFAEPLIRTWFGEAQTSSTEPARLLLLALAPTFPVAVGQTMLMALGVVRQMIWIYVAETVANIALSIVLVGPMGINGVIVATIICSTLTLFPFAHLIVREIGVGALEWTREVILPVLPGVAAQVIAGLLLLPIANGTGSLLVVVALCAATVVVALAAWVLFGLSSRRRREFFQMIRETAGMGEPMPEADLAGDLPAP
jgi:O-antigen/teichoic acid export membrane protein